MTQNEADNLEIHFVYAGNFQLFVWHEDEIRSFILTEMKKNKIKLVMLTLLKMYRNNHITKEKMQNYCTGKEPVTNSVNDDIELLFDDLRMGKKPEDYALTYFLPKLTESEQELAEKHPPEFDKLFALRSIDINWNHSSNMYISHPRIAPSELESSFVEALCIRRTLFIENLSLQKNTTIEKPASRLSTSSENKKHSWLCSF